jgi:hypothetical protein
LPETLALVLADHVDQYIRSPLVWDLERDVVTLSCEFSGEQYHALRQQARARAFHSDLFAPVRERLIALPEYQALVKLRQKLAPATRSLTEVRRQQQRLALDRDTAVDTMAGEELTVRLSVLSRDTEALQERLDASEAGLRQLQAEIDSLEEKCASCARSWIGETAWAAREVARRRAEALREGLTVRPLREALTELVLTEAEQGFLEKDHLVLQHARPILEECGLTRVLEAVLV